MYSTECMDLNCVKSKVQSLKRVGFYFICIHSISKYKFY